ncbi:MAG: lysylphosphatidylglycerol synthase transmembrane domain-containing protein [Candidatus Micrarchaeota archaeon]
MFVLDKRYQLLLNLALSIAIFAGIFYFVGFGKVVSALLNISLPLFALALLVYLCLNIMMAYRVKVVLESIGDRIPTHEVLKSSLAGMLASDFTPARAGYFFTAFSLSSRYGIKLEKTLLSILGPQLFDFMIKVSSAALLMYAIIAMAGGGDMLVNAIVLLVFLSGILAAGLLVFYPPLLPRLSFLKSLPLVPRAFAFIEDMHEHSHKVLAIKWKIVALTSLTWLMKGFEWLLISKALGITITGQPVDDLLFMMVFQAAVTIIQFLPIPTIAGAGASEAGFAAILMPFGVPLESAVAFGFLTRMVMIIVDSLSLPVILSYLQKHSLESVLNQLLRMEH